MALESLATVRDTLPSQHPVNIKLLHSFHTAVWHTLRGVQSSSVSAHNTMISLYFCPLRGTVTKDTWASTISPVWNLMGSMTWYLCSIFNQYRLLSNYLPVLPILVGCHLEVLHLVFTCVSKLSARSYCLENAIWIY